MLLPRLLVYQGEVAACEEHTIDLFEYLLEPLTAFLCLPQVVAYVYGAGAGQRDELVVDREYVLVEVEAGLPLVVCDRLSQDGHQGLLEGRSNPHEGARGVLGQGIEGGASGKRLDKQKQDCEIK